MTMQTHILAALREEFQQWDELIAQMCEEQIITRLANSDWSIKDTMAHLWAWQQRSIARLQAARLNREPEFPKWITDLAPDADGGTERMNAWVYTTYRDEPWSSVYKNWREGFLQFIELVSALSEEDLIEKDYAWFNGYPLYVILVSSYAHHHIEHWEPLLAQLGQPWQAR